MRSVGCAPLTQEQFAPFGQVISCDGKHRSANDERATRFYDLATLTHDTQANKPELSVYRVVPSVLPLTVDYLERHPGSTQLFMPTQAERYLIVVSPSDSLGRPVSVEMKAFVGTASQGVNYAPGVWHYPLVSLDSTANFLMFMWQAEGAYDCEISRLPEPVRIEA